MPADRDQMPLDFDREKREKRERFALIEAVSARFRGLDPDGRAEVGLTPRRWKNVAELLTKLLAFSDGVTSHARRATLAEAIGCSAATIDRARQDAQALGVLDVEPDYNHRGRAENVWRFRWDRLAAVFVSGCHFERGGHQNERGGCHFAEANRNSSSSSSFSNSPPPQPPAHAPRRRPTGPAPYRRHTDPHDPWEVVVVEVLDCGIERAAEAIASARRRGATPEGVRELVAWWQPRRDGFKFPEVALYRRIRQARPGLAVDQAWGEFRPDYAAERERARLGRVAMLKRKHRDTIAAWSPEFKRQYGDEVARQYGIDRRDSRAIFEKVLELLESREVYERTGQP